MVRSPRPAPPSVQAEKTTGKVADELGKLGTALRGELAKEAEARQAGDDSLEKDLTKSVDNSLKDAADAQAAALKKVPGSRPPQPPLPPSRLRSSRYWQCLGAAGPA